MTANPAVPAEPAAGLSYAHPQSGRSRRAVAGVLWSSLQTAIPTLGSALVFFIAARYLSPVDFGLVGLGASLVAIAVGIAPGAFGDALVQRRDIGETHASTAFWLTISAGILLYLPFLLAPGAIAALAREPAIAVLLPVLGLRVPFEMASIVPNALIVRSMQFRLIALRTGLATVASSIVCLVMLWLGHGLWALAASQVTVAVVNALAAFTAARWRPAAPPSLAAIRDLGRYALFASGNRMLDLMSLDQVLVGLAGGAPALGLYYFAKRVFVLLTGLIAGTLSSVSHVLLSSLQGQPEKVREALVFATWASAALAFPAFTGLAVIAHDLVPAVFGAKWEAAVTPVRAFCAIGILASVGTVQAALINSQGRTDWWFGYQVAQQAAGLAVIWIWADDLATMMILLAAKTLLIWPVSVRMTMRLTGLDAWHYLRAFAAPAAASVVMGLAVALVPVLLTLPVPAGGGAATLAVQVVAGALVYAAALWLLARERIARLRAQVLGRKGAPA